MNKMNAKHKEKILFALGYLCGVCRQLQLDECNVALGLCEEIKDIIDDYETEIE